MRYSLASFGSRLPVCWGDTQTHTESISGSTTMRKGFNKEKKRKLDSGCQYTLHVMDQFLHLVLS